MADLYLTYGTALAAMTRSLLEEAGIAAGLDPSWHVVIKPNLVVARPANGGATTHPEIVEGVIGYLRDNGMTAITIAEGSWVGDSTIRAWQACGYRELERKYGVRLVDTKSDDVVKVRSQGYELALCRTIYEADYLINIPVLKGHCQTDMTCCLKNLKGCIPDTEKRRFHTMGLHGPIAALASALRPQLHIVDGICGDLSFEEGGNPIDCGRIMLGFDPVLLDSYGAMLLGYEPGDIEYLRLARDQGAGVFFGEGAEVRELNGEKRPKAALPRSDRARKLGKHIREDGACSACYAALVYALDKHGPPPAPVHIGQGWRNQALAGIGVGNCTDRCEHFVAGCPPKAVDILRFLEETL